MIPEMQTQCYEDRLQLCNLTTLETRRIRVDQIEVFKIRHHGYEADLYYMDCYLQSPRTATLELTANTLFYCLHSLLPFPLCN